MGKAKTNASEPLIFCYRCDCEFSAREMLVNGRERRCPRCGANLDEERFDRHARRLLARRDRLGRRAEAWLERARAARSARLGIGRRAAPLLRRRGEAQRAKAGLANGEALVLARSRYHAGAWFLGNEVPLRAESKNGVSHEILAGYVSRTGFELRPCANKPISEGIIGEFEVFERLRRLTGDPRSFLHGACLVHNVHLPFFDGESLAPRIREIDIVAITRRCVFVIEVKHKKANVSCRFERAIGVENGLSVEGKAARFALEQAEFGAVALSEWFAGLPPERIFRMAVFVDAQKFTSNLSRFEGRAFVGSCPDGWDATLEAMEDAHRSIAPYFSRGEPDAFGAHLLRLFGSAFGAYGTAQARAADMRLPVASSCPRCGARLGVDDVLDASGLVASCSCGARLDGSILDVLAVAAAREAERLKRTASRREKEACRREGEAVPLFVRDRRVRLARRDEEARQLCRAARQARSAASDWEGRLGRLARLRYRGGVWFAKTRIPLERDEAEARYRIDAAYRDDGSLSLEVRSGGVRASSIESEFRVHELLLKAMERTASPLHGGVLLANLYLPGIDGERGGASVREQVDCILLTRSCAFVIEVLRRPSHAIVDASTRTILADTGKGEKLSDARLLDYPLRASSRHAAQFAALSTPFSPDRVHEVVLLADTLSFESTGKGFAGNLYVGCVPQGARRLAAALRGRASMKSSVASRGELLSLGDRLLAAYGSAGSMQGEHVKRVRVGEATEPPDRARLLRLTA